MAMMNQSVSQHTPSATEPAWLRFAPLAVLAVLAFITLLLPKEALRVFDVVGNAVCHRIPARSFFIAGTQLPVCARDTGMFSAALLGLVMFAATLPTRAALFPRRPMLFALALAFALWAFDGFNSYFLLATGRTLFYMPQNWLRLVTGALMGASLSAFVAALFNQAVWRDVANTPTVARWRDVGKLAGVAALIIAVVLWQPDFLFGPIALMSGMGVVTLLTIVNGLLVLIVLRRHGQVLFWRQLVVPAIAGLTLTLIQVIAIDLLRSALTARIGLPF
jgi:uncharacterized membrane protein